MTHRFVSVTARCAVVLCLAAIAAPAMAQWSDDPSANLAVDDLAGNGAQAKILTAPDGTHYISWFSGVGYDVRLQHLDADGNELWAHNGVLVADRGYSSTQDYGLAVDAGSNALLAFRDDRFGADRVTVQKVLSDGSTPWGAGGVQLDDGTGFIGSPKVAGASDGHVYAAWSHDSGTRLARLDGATGAMLWGGLVILANPETTAVVSDLTASDSGSVIMSVVSYVSFLGAKHLYCQRVDTSGASVWGGWTAVMENDSLQFGNFPAFISDGAGGVVTAFYTTNTLQCWVQHVLSDGSEVFVHNGLAVSDDVGNQRSEPTAAYDPVSGSVYAFWRELRANQSQTGVYGQRVSDEDLKQWGANGLQIAPVGANLLSNIRAVADAAGVYVAWDDELSFGNDRLRVSRRGLDGSAAWAMHTDAATSASGKSRMSVAPGQDGSVVLAWSDDRADSGNIYAQNVNADGSLGGTPCAADFDGDGDNDGIDVGLFLQAYATQNPAADINGDGMINGIDVGLFLQAYGLGC